MKQRIHSQKHTNLCDLLSPLKIGSTPALPFCQVATKNHGGSLAGTSHELKLMMPVVESCHKNPCTKYSKKKQLERKACDPHNPIEHLETKNIKDLPVKIMIHLMTLTTLKLVTFEILGIFNLIPTKPVSSSKTCWWFQPSWKICSSNQIISPAKSGWNGVKIKKGMLFQQKAGPPISRCINQTLVTSPCLGISRQCLNFFFTASFNDGVAHTCIAYLRSSSVAQLRWVVGKSSSRNVFCRKFMEIPMIGNYSH